MLRELVNKQIQFLELGFQDVMCPEKVQWPFMKYGFLNICNCSKNFLIIIIIFTMQQPSEKLFTVNIENARTMYEIYSELTITGPNPKSTLFWCPYC